MSKAVRAATITVWASKPRPRIIHANGITYCYLDAVGIVTVIQKDGSAHRRAMTDYEIREHEDQVKRIGLIAEIDKAESEHGALRGFQIFRAAFRQPAAQYLMAFGILLSLVAIVAVVGAWR